MEVETYHNLQGNIISAPVMVFLANTPKRDVQHSYLANPQSPLLHISWESTGTPPMPRNIMPDYNGLFTAIILIRILQKKAGYISWVQRATTGVDKSPLDSHESRTQHARKESSQPLPSLLDFVLLPWQLVPAGVFGGVGFPASWLVGFFTNPSERNMRKSSWKCSSIFGVKIKHV